MTRSQVAKTHAKTLYCLTDKDLEGINAIEKRNPFNKKGPAMKLYKREELEKLAIAKYGSRQKFEAERAKREARRADRAEKRVAAAAADARNSEADGQSGTAAAAGATAAAAAAAAAAPWAQLGLPSLITERIRQLKQLAAQPDATGQYVLYWMKTAIRGHENPALDVARSAARRLGLPLAVASFCLQGHRWANARRWQFLLQGLRCCQLELAAQGLHLLLGVEGLNLQRQGGGGTAGGASDQGTLVVDGYAGELQQSPGWRALRDLAAQAALVVTEDMPVPPDADWLAAAAQHLPEGVGLWAVDCACVVPMQLVGRAHERAAGYRAATQGLRQGRMRAMYRGAPEPCYDVDAPAPAAGNFPPHPHQQQQQQQQSNHSSASLQTDHHICAGSSSSSQQPAFVPPGLSWQPLDLRAADISQLVAATQGLDQSVAPVAHMEGGSRAGYARWAAFKRRGLALYSAQRNDCMQRDGVSRLSAYHHWGMVSPFRVAREAAAMPGSGVPKFLDEFLVWRELSYAFCFYRWPALHTLEALPAWARKTLEAHAADVRPHAKSLQQLEACQTGDAFWDAAQQQLAATGELHNNVRMTWGKAPLQWAPSPAAALAWTLHLNHKYALDGCDPASYAGVLWCFGQFDGPKEPESTPISGSIRKKSTAGYARRINLGAYRSLPA